MSSIIHTKEDDVSSFGDDESFLRGFDVSISWDYPDDFSLKDVQDTVCFVCEEQNAPRSESQFMSDCIQEAGAGVLLLKPHPGADSPPSEMHFEPRSRSSPGEFCIVKISVVSESKHLELYLDDIYEKTSKGCVLSLQKGNKVALYENHFDLSAHVQSSHKFSLRFLSLGERNTMRIQAVIVRVTRCNTSLSPEQPTLQTPSMIGQGNVDISGVREMLQSMGLSIPSKADKLMTDIEHQQKQLQMTQLQGLANVGLMAQLQTITQQQQTLQQQAQSMQLLQSMVPQKSQPSQQSKQQQQQTLQQQAQSMQFLQSMFPQKSQPSKQSQQQQLQQQAHTIQLLQSMFPQKSQPTPQQEQTMPNGYPSPLRAPTSGKTSSRSNSPHPTTNGHISSVGKYPISREIVDPPLSRKDSNASTLRSTSMLSLDLYDGYGASMTRESVLENAVRNEGYSRELARSRASDIEEQNLDNAEYEKTQIGMVKEFLRSEDPYSRKLTITKLPAKHLQRPPRGRPNRRGEEERKPRPHSMSSLPATSEADFTRMLMNLMGEGKDGHQKPGNEERSSGSNARWEAYLRSRVRASHRLSTASSLPSSDYHSDVATSNSQANCCPRCGCPGCLHSFSMIQKELQCMEKRMSKRMDERMLHIQQTLEERMDRIYDLISGKDTGALGYNYMDSISSAV